MELKYIIVVDNDEEESAILFPTKISHRDVAGIHHVTRGPRLKGAGFCDISGDKVVVYGKSESLDGMASKPTDAAIITKAFRPDLV